MSVGNNSRLERCYAGPETYASGYDFPATTRSYNPPPIVCQLPMPLHDNGLNTKISEPGTWSHGTTSQMFEGRSSLLDSHDRFKPEKIQRRPVQKMKWNQSRWSRSLAGDLFSCSYPRGQGGALMSNNYPNNFTPIPIPPLPVESESRVSSMTIADVSPRIAVKKVLLLYEHAQYREAASFIQRLSVGTFRIIIRELPMDVFVEAMPHSLPIMEALYTKVFTSDGPEVCLKPLKPESVILHMVKFFSRDDLAQNRNRRENPLGPFTSGCKKILQVIVVADPKMTKTLLQRQKALNKTVEGMGQHGLVGTSDESLLPLHDALKLEFRRVVDTYKGALQKLEDLALSNRNNPKSVARGPAPIQASHQRQLSLRAEEIQDRLIKNKSLLNVVEPTLDNHCMDILLGILQRRIECDKDALFHFTQLRKEAGDITTDRSVVAPLLMKYSRGCKQVLEMMREIAKEIGNELEDYEDDSSDLSGYHSDSDSAIMTSGNSPYITPRARYNFLSRSVRSKQILRPSLLSSGGSSSRSGFIGIGGMGGSGSPEAGEFHSSQSTTTSNTPTRPRHIKLKNQLHKNNSLGKVSNASESSASSGNGSVESEDYARQLSPTSGLNCVECVTLVSVPDDQVITQGVNHHCAITAAAAIAAAAKNHNKNNTSVVDSTNTMGLPVSHLSHNNNNNSNNSNERLITDLRNEINQLRRGLHNANATIHHLEQREKNLLTSARSSLEVGLSVGNLNGGGGERDDGEECRSRCIREYGQIYAQARVVTMDSLDKIPQLVTADELKSKLLFSVIVLAFRAVQCSLVEMKTQIQSVLQMNINVNGGMSSLEGNQILQTPSKTSPVFQFEFQPHQAKVLDAIGQYLQHASSRFDLSRPVQQVSNQLWTTLYDYPFLKDCEGLKKYIEHCVLLAWNLSNLTPPCVLEYETRVYMREMHVRYHSSDQSSETIKTYLWPALLKGPNGPCLHKGVVIT